MNNTQPNSVKYLSLKYKKSTFLNSSMISSFILASLMTSSLTWAEDDFKDEINVNVIESRSYDDCLYFGKTVLEVKYQLESAESALLVLEGSLDNVRYEHISSTEVSIGIGSLLLTFDAGECLKNTQVTFK
jgi:hypothetical protein